MMLPDYAAITATFMAVGMSGNDEALYSRLLGHWDKGCFELHYELCQYATLSEQDCGGECSTREVKVEDDFDIESDTYFELEMS